MYVVGNTYCTMQFQTLKLTSNVFFYKLKPVRNVDLTERKPLKNNKKIMHPRSVPPLQILLSIYHFFCIINN
jgi:hypothetical protein